MARIKIGWAQTSITPDRPVYNPGQHYPRVSEYVHDQVMCTALALDNGETCAIMMSLDMVAPPSAQVVGRVRYNLSQMEGFSGEYLSVSATHTHNSIAGAPGQDAVRKRFGKNCVEMAKVPDNILEGEEFNDFLVSRMTQAAREAWETRSYGGVSSASDYAAVAFNRRPVFAKDGKEESIMYGVASRDDFVRYEGGSDHSAEMIYTWDANRKLTGVAVVIPCPSQVFELHPFITADYWHYTREEIRAELGDIFVLPLCGAAGDQNPLDLTRISKDNTQALREWGAQAGPVFRNFDMADECRDIACRITDAVKRGLRKAKNDIESHPVLRHNLRSLTMPIRKVSEEEYQEAVEQMKGYDGKFSEENLVTGADLVTLFEPLGVIGRYEQQCKSETVQMPMHCLRIGSTALVTCPFELFVEYAFRIKARAVSRRTAVVQLTDTSLGYLPTRAAISGGSYSSKPASTVCGPDSGDYMVEEALKEIEKLWD